MKTLKLTPIGLQLLLLKIKDWHCPQCGKDAESHYFQKQVPEHMKSLPAAALWDKKDLYPCYSRSEQKTIRIPDATHNLAVAIALFLEMNYTHLISHGDGWEIKWGQATGSLKSGSCRVSFDPFDIGDLNAKIELCLAIGAAYVQWSTGDRVEILPEETVDIPELHF